MQAEKIIQAIKNIYAVNAFMKYCGIKIHHISCGKATVGLTVDPAIHTNLSNKLHGGLLMTLIDNATGVACAAVGKRVVTVSMSVSFIKSAAAGANVEARAEISSQHDNLFTMQVNVFDTDTTMLLATGMCTMMTIADFPEIPNNW